MLNHLDDHNDDDLPADFRERVHRRVRSLQRRRRIVSGSAVVLVAVVGVSAGLYARAFDRVGDVERLTVAGTGDPVDAHDRTILVVGSDSGGEQGRDDGSPRTDTILLARLHDNGADILSIPRDLVVDDAGDGEANRINAVAGERGYSALVDVVESEFGVNIDSLIRVDMSGFAELVDLAGGIDVQFAHPTRDDRSGLEVTVPGCHRLDGDQALALARSRQMRSLVDGRWQLDPTGDLGRIDRQSTLLATGLQALTRTRPDPLTADRLAGWLADQAAVDDNLDDGELISIATKVMSLTPADVSFTTVAVEPYLLEGASVLRTTESAAETRARWETGAAPPGTGQSDRLPQPNAVTGSISLCASDG